MKNIRAIALSSAFALVSVGGAVAADMSRPVYKAPVAAPVPYYNWTGVYAGGHLGYGWGKFSVSDAATPSDSASLSPSGVIGGLQLGYNHQINNFVFGIEGDISWSGIKKETTFTDDRLTAKTTTFGTVTGRVGTVVYDRTLLYVKGGYAWSQNKYSSFDTVDGFSQNIKDNRNGWTVGAGAEYALTDRWTTRLEYNYLDFGSKTLTYADVTSGPIAAKIKSHDHVLKVGLNYRF